MPVFKVKGKIEIPFECEVTAMNNLDAASWIERKSASHVYNEHVASFDEAEVVVGDVEEKLTGEK